MIEENSTSFLKRYRLLLILIVLLFVIGIGCWLVKKRDPNLNDNRKDELLRKLNGN